MRKKVLVTGAGGFIGSHLCERLVQRGYEVKAFVKYNSNNFWGWLDKSEYKNNIEIVPGDIRNYDSVKFAVKGVQTIFHLAALIGIPYSYHSPDSYIDTNVKGTENILQAARDLDVSRVVHTSTSEVYGTAQFIPISERHPINPQSPYAASKAAADFLALSFYRSFGLPVTIIRPFNTYGPRQSCRAVIPTIITQLLGNAKKISLGSLHPLRDFTYVNDTVDGFIKISRSGEAVGQVINTGTGKETSIKELLILIGNLMNIEIKVGFDKSRKRPKNSEVERLKADIKKARTILDWKPRYNLENGLKETIDWIRENKHTYKDNLYNV